jgi:hypothetical protein
VVAKRGREPGFVMTDEHRLKIKNSNILTSLIKCAEGELEMSPTRVTVALGLMKKVFPDLSSVQQSGETDHNVTFGWRTSNSTTSHENSSFPSTTEPSDLPASLPTDEPEKP